MIWRRLLLRNDHSIADLHYTIQIAMGWSDSNLNRFHIHGKDYGVAHEGGLTFSDNPERVRLAQFGFRLRERFLVKFQRRYEKRHGKCALRQSPDRFGACFSSQGKTFGGAIRQRPVDFTTNTDR